MHRILKLDDQLSNQIAAGEVVERPGAALKELVENSLDAGAKNIRVQIKGGGIDLLEVADDGHGIHGDDLLLALDRHATSKIRKTEDLFAIRTWGFRGEALASIAAVSRLTINSRTAEAETGSEILMEGGNLLDQRSIARPQGTTIRVEDLFFNTPARRKFLKSQGAETSLCLQALHRLALSSHELSLELTLDGKREFLYARAASMEARVAQVYNEAWGLKIQDKDLTKIEAASGELRLTAWILPSKQFIPSSRGILTFVNNRSVKDKLIQQSILAAAKEVLFGSLYPQLVLFLDLPPEAVDVNVHPTKSELRFRDPGHVFAFIRKHIEKALADDRRGSIDLFNSSATLAPTYEQPVFSQSAPALFETSTHFHQKAPEMPLNYTAASPMEIPPLRRGPQFLGTLRNTYIVCQDDQGLLLVDQHAAHERVTYEKLKSQRLAQTESAPLLIPIQVEIPKQALDRWENQYEQWAELGFVVDRTGPTLLAIREIPATLLRKDGSPAINLGHFLRQLSQTDEGDQDLGEKLREKILHSLATESCHGSVRAGQSLSSHEAYALLSQMSDTDFSGHCPHGRPTTVRLEWPEIERLFKRIN